MHTFKGIWGGKVSLQMDLLCVLWMKKERQLQLIKELLISDSSGNSVHLSEEQRSALAFLSTHSQAAQAAKNNLNSSRRSDPHHAILINLML